MGIRLAIEKGRLSFATGLWVASAMEEGAKKKFGCDIILTPETRVYVVNQDGSRTPVNVLDVLLSVANDTWKGKGKEMLEALEASKKCLRNGNVRMNKSGDVLAGYEGHYYIAAKSSTRPGVFGVNREPLTEADGKPYSGCYVNASIDVYGIADPAKKGVHASLRGVQFHSDGEAFGGGSAATADDFADLSVGGATPAAPGAASFL